MRITAAQRELLKGRSDYVWRETLRTKSKKLVRDMRKALKTEDTTITLRNVGTLAQFVVTARKPGQVASMSDAMRTQMLTGQYPKLDVYIVGTIPTTEILLRHIPVRDLGALPGQE